MTGAIRKEKEEKKKVLALNQKKKKKWQKQLSWCLQAGKK